MRSSTGNVKKIRLNNKEARGAWRQSTLQGSEAAGGQGCFSTAAARRQNPLQLVDNQCGGGDRKRTEVTDLDTKKIAGFIGASSRICANSFTTFPNTVSAQTDSITDSWPHPCAELRSAGRSWTIGRRRTALGIRTSKQFKTRSGQASRYEWSDSPLMLGPLASYARHSPTHFARIFSRD